jgi:hypothetical protein
MERIEVEVVVAYVSRHLLGRAEETHTRTSLGIVVVRPMLRPSIF